MRRPKSPKEFRFNRYDKQRLKQALCKVADKRGFRRQQAVLLFAQGVDVHTVARIAVNSVRVVYKWMRLYVKSIVVAFTDAIKRAKSPKVFLGGKFR